MRQHFLLSFVATIALVTSIPALAAEIETKSQIDAVTVYPDGATVTRLIRLDLPAGDSTLFARDFPTTLDPSSLRVEGEGGGRIVIGLRQGDLVVGAFSRIPVLQKTESFRDPSVRLLIGTAFQKLQLASQATMWSAPVILDTTVDGQ